MPGEIQRLLQAIEYDHLTCKRALLHIEDAATRTKVIMMYTARIAQTRTRLIELIGNSACMRCDEIIEAADLLFQAQQARMQEQERASC